MSYSIHSFITRVITLTGAASLSALGCGSEVDPPGGSDADNVYGSIINTYIGETEEVTAVPSGVAIEALVPQEGGGFKSFPAEVESDGSFEIPGLTEGTTYYLKLTGGDPLTSFPRFFVTSAGKLNLGSYINGRPDTKPITITPTDVRFELTGLNPSQATDAFELYSQGAGVVAYLYFPDLMPGATALTNVTNDAFEMFYPNVLIESAKGDATTVTQLVSRDAGGVPYQAIGKVAKVAPVTMVDGQLTTVTGSFEDVPQTSITLDWKRSAFGGFAADVHPEATVSSSSFTIYAEAAGPSRFTRSASPTALQLFDDADTPSDLTAELTYGDPFPSGWDLIASATVNHTFKVAVPGTDTMRTVTGYVGCFGSVKGFVTTSFASAASPVKAVQVNGMSATSALTGVGASPTVSFSAPASGAAGHYVIDIRKVTTTLTSTVASFVTTETSVTIPEGILETGSAYLVRITAQPKGTDISKPYQLNAFGCYAQALSSIFSP
jgi:hypothetical protein